MGNPFPEPVVVQKPSYKNKGNRNNSIPTMTPPHNRREFRNWKNPSPEPVVAKKTSYWNKGPKRVFEKQPWTSSAQTSISATKNSKSKVIDLSGSSQKICRDKFTPKQDKFTPKQYKFTPKQKKGNY